MPSSWRWRCWGCCVAAGFFYRVAIALLFVAFTYVQLLDVTTYLNHYYLVSLLAGLLCFVPAHRAFSSMRGATPRCAGTGCPRGARTCCASRSASSTCSPGWPSSPRTGWSTRSRCRSGSRRARACRSWGRCWTSVGRARRGLGRLPLRYDHRRSSCSCGGLRPFAYVVVLGFHAATCGAVPHRDVPRDHGHLRAGVLRLRAGLGGWLARAALAPVPSPWRRLGRVPSWQQGAGRAGGGGALWAAQIAAAAADPPLWRQRALARAGHALLVARDGAGEERQRHLRGALAEPPAGSGTCARASTSRRSRSGRCPCSRI